MVTNYNSQFCIEAPYKKNTFQSNDFFYQMQAILLYVILQTTEQFQTFINKYLNRSIVIMQQFVIREVGAETCSPLCSHGFLQTDPTGSGCR